MEKWDQRFMLLASHIATWSKDRSTKVGAVIVGPSREIRSTGYNGFPSGVDDDVPERHERPAKYAWSEHAERNALYFASAIGVSVAGCTLYSTAFPCADCARGILRSGLARVVAPTAPEPIGVPGDWRESCRIARTMFCEAGVVLFESDYATQYTESRRLVIP